MIETVITTKVLPLVLTAIGFGLLITIHEFGHFIFCKLFGIHTPIFSIGFGPALIHTKFGDTEFRLSLIPLGGYCAIQDHDDEEDSLDDLHREQLNPSESLSAKPYWQQLIVMLGGIAFNLAFAYGAFTALHYGTNQKYTYAIEAGSIQEASPLKALGIDEKAVITGWRIDTTQTDARSTDAMSMRIHLTSLTTLVAKTPRAPITLTLQEQNGVKNELILDESTTKLGCTLSLKATPIEGETEHTSFADAIQKGIALTHHYINHTIQALKNAVTSRSTGTLGGPIAIFSQTFKGAQQGLRTLLHILGNISIALAVTNLLPFGMLDGGRIFFATVEAIIRRSIPRAAKEAIMMLFLALFLFLVLILSYKDIMRLWVA
jgi:regulator of sigma E protease